MSFWDPQHPAVVIDTGSATTRAGVSTEDEPRISFPSQVALDRIRFGDRADDEGPSDLLVGSEIKDEYLDTMAVSNPVEGGRIEFHDHVDVLWEHAFSELGVEAKNHAVLLSEPAFNAKHTREKMVESLFETFDVPALSLQPAGLLALQGQGRTSGLVLDVGDGAASVTPIMDGYVNMHAIGSTHVAGSAVTRVLRRFMMKENLHNEWRDWIGRALATSRGVRSLTQFKEQHCFVAENQLEPVRMRQEYRARGDCGGCDRVSFWLPDGNEVAVGPARTSACEVLWNPSLLGMECPDIGQAITECIDLSDVDNRKPLVENLVLCGGTTLLPGFDARFKHELRELVTPTLAASLRIVGSPASKPVQRKCERLNSVWQGGATGCALRDAQPNLWFFKEEYEECGVGLIHDKIAIRR